MISEYDLSLRLRACASWLRGRSGAHELVEHPVERADPDGKMAFALLEVRSHSGHVGGKPHAVRERHHEISTSLPNQDRTRDLVEIEPPRMDEGQVIV